MAIYRITLFFFLAVLVSGCSKNKLPEPEPLDIENHKKYLHLSHTRTASNNIIDKQVEDIPYQKYDMLWLGGDLALHTSLEDEVMLAYNILFDFDNPNTLWALGNHDYSDLSRVSYFTERPAFYSYSINNICFLVLDTQDDLSNISGAQAALFNQVMDTIEQSTHLIILHHKLIWMYGDPVLEGMISNVSNGGLGNCFYCINPNNFYTDIYPRLVETKNKGIEILCVGGDIGFYANEFEWTTDEGIYFLASGISSGQSDNQAIVFSHDLLNNTLDWKFELLSNLVK